MQKIIIIDFDHTLFNAQAFKKDLAKALDLKELYKNNDYKKQLKKFSKQQQQKFLKILKNSKKYLYKDAVKFLQQNHKSTKGTKNTNIFLLSKGQPSFQKIKIKNCGMDKYAKIRTVPKSKINFIKKIKNKKNIIFINDRGKEIDEIKKAFQAVITVWIRRSNGYYRNESCKLYDKKINNLKIKL